MTIYFENASQTLPQICTKSDKVVINPIRPRGGGLFAIPLSKLIAETFGMVIQFQNLMVFQVEGTYIAY